MRIAMASLKRGIDFSRHYTIIFRPSTPEIVLKGLSTLNDLSTPILTPDPKFKNSK